MTDLPDWAKDRAREWLDDYFDDTWTKHPLFVEHLSALLVEVAQRAADEERKLGLAEVRRVVVEAERGWRESKNTCWAECCEVILSRLDALK